jgi:hydroxymethylbilane synthase
VNLFNMPIATRTSPLALAQTRDVQARLARAHGEKEPEESFPILGLTTTGDKITDRALLLAGGKGLFTKELERALLDRKARFAVHSMKDVPTTLPEGLEIACVLEREDPRDVLLTRDGISRIEDLPEGATLGTASIRRQSQALALRPDLNIVLLRGNVDTRLEKLRSGEMDATFLARAGLRRLGREQGELPPLELSAVIPAPAQGAVGIEICSDDDEARRALEPLNHLTTQICIAAERGFLQALDGSCRTPIAAHATLDGLEIHLRGEALTPDGSKRWANETRTQLPELDPGAARLLGYELGLEVKRAGGDALARIVAETG